VKIVASLIGIALLCAGAFVIAARSGALDASPAEAQARYGAPPSQFADIDGTRIHYRDEGRGPVLVLLHGSRGSLQQWDGWVHELGGRFRIVRMDGLASGLTGPDGRADYGAERSLVLMNGLLERLKVGRFILVGTSSGATQAVRYAAAYPERVEKLLLSTVPLQLPATARTSRADRFVYWLHDEVLRSTATDLYWRTFLTGLFGDPRKVTPQLVHRYRVLNTLPGQQQRFTQRLATWRRDGGPARDYALAARVTAPTLIQWGGAGPVLPRELFCSISAAFTSTRVSVIIYPALGHMLVLEDPAGTARDALAFIVDGSGADECARPSPAPAAALSSASLAASSR
jgi:pimeloyl-ACP methyl ester carboxylesterase